MEQSTSEPRPPKKSNKLLMVGAVVAVLIIVGAVVVVALAGNSNTNTNSVYYLTVAPKDQKAQIDAGLIDGGVSWEPFVSDSLLAGSAHVINWSADIWPNHPCCVLTVKSS